MISPVPSVTRQASTQLCSTGLISTLWIRPSTVTLPLSGDGGDRRDTRPRGKLAGLRPFPFGTGTRARRIAWRSASTSRRACSSKGMMVAADAGYPAHHPGDLVRGLVVQQSAEQRRVAPPRQHDGHLRARLAGLPGDQLAGGPRYPPVGAVDQVERDAALGAEPFLAQLVGPFAGR